jgi:3-oxoacyl-[acyl-carrier-protein] synthase-3
MTQAHTRIFGTGFVVGEKTVTNEQFSKVCDTSDEWIRERSGIQQRYFVKEGTATSDLGVAAAKKALDDAGCTPNDIDYVVCATMTPDYYFPGIGSIVQAKLGMSNVPALDIRQQCSGFIYGMQVCDALIRSGAAKRLLFVGAEVHTGFMPFSKSAWNLLMGDEKADVTQAERDWHSKFRHLIVLFGDAAGAVVMGPTEDSQRGLLGYAMHSDGRNVESLYVPSAGFAYRPYFDETMAKEGRGVPVMDGKQVFKMAVTKMPEAIGEVCAKVGVKLDDPHRVRRVPPVGPREEGRPGVLRRPGRGVSLVRRADARVARGRSAARCVACPEPCRRVGRCARCSRPDDGRSAPCSRPPRIACVSASARLRGSSTTGPSQASSRRPFPRAARPGCCRRTSSRTGAECRRCAST